MKKIILFLLSLLILCLPLFASAEAPRVVDDADLFTPAQEAELAATISRFQQETGMDFVIYTSDEVHFQSQQTIADDFYDHGGYGFGEERDGILYFIDMYERIPYLCTTGAMIDYMTDSRIEYAHNSAHSFLADGDYANAAMQMIYAVYGYWERGIPEGQYRYDLITGQRLTARHKVLTGSELLVCGLIALVTALLFAKSVQGSYTLRGRTYHYYCFDHSTVNVTKEVDEYLRTTTSRTRIVHQSSSGGGFGSSGHSGGSAVHRSSSGTTHGGGAGKRF